MTLLFSMFSKSTDEIAVLLGRVKALANKLAGEDIFKDVTRINELVELVNTLKEHFNSDTQAIDKDVDVNKYLAALDILDNAELTAQKKCVDNAKYFEPTPPRKVVPFSTNPSQEARGGTDVYRARLAVEGAINRFAIVVAEFRGDIDRYNSARASELPNDVTPRSSTTTTRASSISTTPRIV